MKSYLLLAFSLVALTVSAQSKKTEDFHLDKEYKLNSDGIIYLNASDAKVTITGSARATAHVKIDREITTQGITFGERGFTVDVVGENGNLSVKERSNGTTVNMVGYYDERYTIKIEAPEGASVVIRGNDGNYSIEAVNGSIDVNVDDADVQLTGCKGNSFRVRMDDGDLRMDTGKGSLEVDADDGDVDIKNASFEKISARLDDGDFIIDTSLSANGEYSIHVKDGSIEWTVRNGGGQFDVRHDDARVVTTGNFDEVEKTEKRTRLTLAGGNARIDIRADDARVRLVKN